MKTRNVGNAAVAGIGYTIGNILIKGLSFITLPIFTRLMSTEAYGLYTTFVSYESIITLVISLGLHASLKAAKVEYKEKVDEYVSTVMVLPMLFLLGTLLMLIPFGNIAVSFLGLNRLWIILMLVQSWGSTIVTMYNCRISLDFAYKKYLLLSLVNSFSNVVLSLILVTTVCKNNTFVGRAIGTSVPVIIVAVVLCIAFFKKAKATCSKEYIRFGLSYSLPLIPHGVSQLILAQFGKIVIQKKVGNEAAGVYGFAYTIALIPQIVITSLDTVWGPWFFSAYEKGDIKGIKTRTTQYVALFSAFTGGVFCVAPEIVKLMSASEYWDAIEIVGPAVLGVYFTFLYTIPSQVEHYYKKTKYIAIGTVAAAVLNVAANVILVPRYGYEAAVYVTVATYVVYFVFHVLIANGITKGEPPFSIMRICGYAICVCAMCGTVQIILDKWILRYLLALLWCVGIALINKNVLREELGKVFARKK